MSDVVWIASYPKSGNTWVRFLIAQLIGDGLVRSADLQVRIPDAHKVQDWSRFEARGTALVKTHWLPRHLPQRLGTAGVIYIARNPFDVIASNFRFAMLCADETTVGRPEAERRQLRMVYVERFLRHHGDPRWIELGFGSWRQHLQAWRRFVGGRPALFLRYEDLHDDPAAVARTIVRFLNLDADEARIARAVEASSFGAMRRLEEREIEDREKGLFFGQPGRGPGHAAGHRFVAKGAATFGRDEFDPDQRQRIREVFAAELDRLGYRDAVDATAPAPTAALSA